MPYIKQEEREKINSALFDLIAEVDLAISIEEHVDGMLNYVITNLMLSFFNGQGYVGYERAIGLLECCKLELYRRLVSKYEDEAIERNGDVYV